MPPLYWAEAMHVATHLLNIRPTKALPHKTPHEAPFGTKPPYDHLRTFGCLCFPNIEATSPHKLAPRSVPCVFVGYPTQHKGYRCLDLSTNNIIISRHVTFDELVFPFASRSSPPTTSYDFPHDAPIPDSPFTTFPGASGDPPTPNLLPRQPATPDDHASASTQPSTTCNSPSSPPNLPSASPDLSSSPCTPPSSPAIPPAAVPVLPPDNPHPMRTRAKSGFHLPRKQLNFSVQSSISPIPKTYRSALHDPNWSLAMREEFDALQSNNTWSLVSPPPGANIISGKWVFRHKFNSDGSLSRYKARWVVRGFCQEHGIDYEETFSPVVKPSTIRLVLSLAVSSHWPVHQLDVKNAFLHGSLSETVYCQQPSGFEDPSHPSLACLLNKSLYGLKQAPRAWFTRFATFITSVGFVASKCDTSLFIYHTPQATAYLLLYVDNIVLTASSASFVDQIISSLRSEFSMTDLGSLSHFLGIHVTRSAAGMFLSQRQYCLDIIQRAAMDDCNISKTPIEAGSKLSISDGDLLDNPTHYRSLAGALQYLTITRPDISYAVQQACLFMHAPRTSHLNLIKRIIRYIKGTLDHGTRITPTSASSLTAYSDADWAGCPDTRRSTSGFCVFFGENLISWSSKRQLTVSRSSAEAEYRAVAHVVAETCWLRQVLQELHRPISRATVVYCDNVSAVYLSANPVQHRRTKHIEIDIHFVREKVAIGEIKVLHVPTTLQFADIFTKGLPTAVFNEFRSSLTVLLPDDVTAGGC